MKNVQATILFLFASCFFMATAQAHDPSEHMKKAEKPKCESMKNRDHSKMDENDPIMMAVMKKCMSEEPDEEHNAGDSVRNPADDGSVKKAEKHTGGHDR